MIKRFTVRGDGEFPLDMLRYDRCWPESQADSMAMKGDETEGARSVALESITDRPTPMRWASYGWTVTEGGE